jgi:hypothetical protein
MGLSVPQNKDGMLEINGFAGNARRKVSEGDDSTSGGCAIFLNFRRMCDFLNSWRI